MPVFSISCNVWFETSEAISRLWIPEEDLAPSVNTRRRFVVTLLSELSQRLAALLARLISLQWSKSSCILSLLTYLTYVIKYASLAISVAPSCWMANCLFLIVPNIRSLKSAINVRCIWQGTVSLDNGMFRDCLVLDPLSIVAIIFFVLFKDADCC